MAILANSLQYSSVQVGKKSFSLHYVLFISYLQNDKLQHYSINKTRDMAFLSSLESPLLKLLKIQVLHSYRICTPCISVPHNELD